MVAVGCGHIREYLHRAVDDGALAADPTAGTTVPPCSTHGVVAEPPDGDAVTVTLTVLVAAGCGFAVIVLVTVTVLTVVLVARKA